MHKKFTLHVSTVFRIAAIAFLGVMLGILETKAQTKWSGVYGNEWLAGKYGQTWLKIGVIQNGIQKVLLPAAFQNKSGQLHLYHRGKEVALTSATATEIEFYGIVNDGASDALLYRPYTGTKANPYYSWYSDESSYFLTFSDSPANIAVTQGNIATSGTPEPYHLQEDLKLYTNSDTYDGSQNIVLHALDQSYLIEGKGRSSQAFYRRNSATPGGNPIFGYGFQLKNLAVDPARSPVVELLLNGRTYSNNIIKASVGKTSGSLSAYPQLIQFSDFIPFKTQYSITPGIDVDANGNGYLQLESTQITDQSSSTGVFSVTYLKLIYPQSFDMSGVNSMTFNLLPTTNESSNVSITNAPSNAKVYDVSDPDSPRIISGNYVGTTLNLMVQRVSNTELNLLVTNEAIANTRFTSGALTTFTNYDPAGSDYLVITNETLFNAASDYVSYRGTTAGGSYKTVLVKIKDIYNQFNYGEPSPVAIRRFVDYMVRRAPRAKHNLLLIGPSTTLSGKLVLNRELNEDVPTIGFPGSDVLLVEGLADGTAEVPAIPVGRISATTSGQVNNYLDKVKTYESQLQQATRKKIMHINGGLYDGETSKFAGYLNDYVPLVTGTAFKGTVTAKVKGATDFAYPSNALNIADDVNGGFGMMTYFGHGSSHYTDYDIGYVTDPARGYTNEGKYPIMYFNGCGVGNIFNGGFSPFPTATLADQIPLSSDWLLASKKGSVAIIGNSYYAFESSSENYLGKLYQGIFKSDAERQTIGLIHKATAKLVIDGGASDYDVANNHQSLLFGDPALKVLSLSSPLPVDLVLFEAKLIGIEKVQLNWKTAWEKNNSHFLVQRSYNAKNFEVIGMVEGKGDTNSESSYTFIDNSPNAGDNYYRLVQVDISGNTGSVSGDDTYSRIVSIKIPNTSQVVLQPNPTPDKFVIKLQTNVEIKFWNLINIQGRSLKVNGSGSEVDLANYPAGEYIIELHTENGDVYRKKVVKF
ncbi:C25 family cysteine peptidase [Dyadobacter subterraneus]|uniref:T9SS type A sorting domain-containing protein n=1 Tax=Dyadobacter subterraneus TaxID=2773304 RepID=A0ABR9WHW1_9BACT|nr:C25 family cysteine peptidase [Dyadobacter subterraneus]MBE9465082.1 T9SS type A sorting domain-containing protein [Dyadobacter subterraneus]